jgi:hypothetical protein
MVHAETNVAAALLVAQGKKSTRTNIKAGSNLPGTKKVKIASAPAPVRAPITFEGAARLCPSQGVIAKIVVVYGLDAVDYDAIREATEAAIATMSNSLAPYMNEKALEMHLQRIVGAHIGSAHGAGSFYDSKAEQARNLTSAIMNEDRDGDRMGVDGQANRAERARDFAATAAVQSFAALAAAHGAKDAYTEITGEEWKPYVSNALPGRTVDARAAAAQVAAFDRDA